MAGPAVLFLPQCSDSDLSCAQLLAFLTHTFCFPCPEALPPFPVGNCIRLFQHQPTEPSSSRKPPSFPTDVPARPWASQGQKYVTFKVFQLRPAPRPQVLKVGLQSLGGPTEDLAGLRLRTPEKWGLQSATQPCGPEMGQDVVALRRVALWLPAPCAELDQNPGSSASLVCPKTNSS